MTAQLESISPGQPHDQRVHAPLDLFVGGQWEPAQSGEVFDSIDPFTGQPWVQAASAGEADVDRAVSAARAAFEGPWSRTPPAERGRLLRVLADLIVRDAERLAHIETRDNGKLIRETSGLMASQVPQLLHYFAGAADKIAGDTLPTSDPAYFVYTLREPVGVVAAIVPWNNPIFILLMKVAPALAAGCTVVAKTADQTPVSTLALAELFEEAGFPPGVFNVLTGPGLPAGRLLVQHPDVDKVSFTGSTATGKSVMKDAADHLAEVTLELGGKSPNIVFADADIDAAVNGVVAGVFASSGQMCIAGGRLLVQQDIHDDFVARLAARASQIRLGDPLDHESEMGPLVSERQLQRVLELVQSAQDEGAVLVCGGKRPTDERLRDGYFIEPTIFAGVSSGMRLAREEAFGPVLVVIPFKDEPEAIAIANDTLYGLASGVWTLNVQRAHRMAKAIRSGVEWINCYRNVGPNVPFGGMKQSGFGRENGMEAMNSFLQTKSVWMELSGATRDPFAMPTAPAPARS
jgi:acyl-CoA reductase-like NAD-dependent aldehyde dehydrogenase